MSNISEPVQASNEGIEDTELPPGVARIKPKYIVSKRPHEDVISESDPSMQPPPKKKSRRGQNKYRPPVKIPYSSQLCPSFHIGSNRKCSFGEKCRYLHNVQEFLQLKPPDISESCYVFEEFGYCPSGIACRYGNSHIDSTQGTSIINEAVYDRGNGPNKVVNGIPRKLQEELRKRKIPFPRSDAFLETIKQTTEDKGNKEQISVATSSDDNGGTQNHGISLPDTSLSVNTGNNDDGGRNSIDEGSKDKHSENDKDALMESSVSVGDSQDTTCFSTVTSPVGVADTDLPCPLGPITDEDSVKIRPLEKITIDFKDKLYLAPLTTVGNLPYRRICKKYGADITCSEMALSINLLQGQQSEWALLKRHESEDLFGAQICGSFPDTMTRCAELISTRCSVDFVDINTGCPIDLIFKKGAGCALMQRKGKFRQIVTGMSQVLDVPLTVKMRTGVYDKNWNAHKLVTEIRDWGASLITIHGRSREQRYTKLADWEYIDICAKAAAPLPVFGNGDILSFEDYNSFRERSPHVSGTMIARGALVKPWIFTEIKEQRHWDISSSERLSIVKDYVNYGLEHWGSDTQGVERVRKFLLEWLSFLHRYIPYGLLERTQKLNERPPYFVGRDDLETLMASRNCKDWVKISEMFLGPVPDNFSFLPKHKANSYS